MPTGISVFWSAMYWVHKCDGYTNKTTSCGRRGVSCGCVRRWVKYSYFGLSMTRNNAETSCAQAAIKHTHIQAHLGIRSKIRSTTSMSEHSCIFTYILILTMRQVSTLALAFLFASIYKCEHTHTHTKICKYGCA